jgi:hypothetical protein
MVSLRATPTQAIPLGDLETLSRPAFRPVWLAGGRTDNYNWPGAVIVAEDVAVIQPRHT